MHAVMQQYSSTIFEEGGNRDRSNLLSVRVATKYFGYMVLWLPNSEKKMHSSFSNGYHMLYCTEEPSPDLPHNLPARI